MEGSAKKIKHFDIDDTYLKEEQEFVAIGSQAILSALNRRIDGCGKSTTYLHSKLSGLEESIKSIGDKNVELQDTINSHRKVAECGGANFKLSLAELKNMQENFSRLQTEMEARFLQGLTQCGSEHSE